MTDLALQFGVYIFLHGTIVLGLAWGITWGAKNMPASATHVVWTTAFGVLLLLPVGSAFVPGWTIDLTLNASSSSSSFFAGKQVPASSSSVAGRLGTETMVEPEKGETTGKTAGHISSTGQTQRPSVLRWTFRWGPLGFLLIWGGGVLLLFGRFGIGMATFSVRWQSLQKVNDTDLVRTLASRLSIDRSVSVYWSSRVQVPTVWGLLSPVILLPEKATQWSQPRLRSVLLHELAHVKRWDPLTHVVNRLTRALFWPNPLVWRAAANATAAQERACDDVVLRSGVASWEYAEQLLAVTKTLRDGAPPINAVAFDARRQFKSRMRALLKSAPPRRAVTRREVGLFFATGLLVLTAVSAIQLGPPTDDQNQGRQYWLEAERGTSRSTVFAVQNDEAASEHSYVTVTDQGDLDHPPEQSDLSYSFKAEASGQHVIWARVRVSSNDHNSLWLRVDSTRWIRWNGIEPGKQWHWVQVRDADQGKQPVAFALSEGRHHLELGPREDGIDVDQFVVTDNWHYRPRPRPARSSSSEGEEMIWLEAEDGAPEPPLYVERGAQSSGWHHLAARPETESRHSPPITGRASYSFTVDQADTYRLWGRVIAPSSDSDSYWVRIDGGPWIRWNGIRQSNSWHWDQVHDADDANTPVEFKLSEGEHHLTIAYRERDTKLDRLLLTSRATYRPRGVGNRPDAPVSVSRSLSPSNATLTPPMSLHSDSQSVAPGNWIGVPDGPGNDVSDPGSGAATWTVSVPEEGEYVLAGEVLAPAINDNSFYVSVDDGKEIAWHTPAPEGTTEEWTWDPVSHLSDEGHTDPVLFSLDEGRHKIHLRNREDGTRLRQLRLVNAPFSAWRVVQP